MKLTRTQVTNVNSDKMKIVHINVNGILAKRYKMMQFVLEHQPDIVAISETHLK